MATTKALLNSTLEAFLSSKSEAIAHASLPTTGTNTISVVPSTKTDVSTTYIAPADGWLSFWFVTTNASSDGAWYQLKTNPSPPQIRNIIERQNGTANDAIPVCKGMTVTIDAHEITHTFRLDFLPCNGI